MQLMFTKLFKPRWQHAKATIRKDAIQRLKPDDDHYLSILTQLASQDTDIDVRREAIDRLSCAEPLQELYTHDPLPEIRRHAAHRICELISAKEADSLDQEILLKLLNSLTETDLLTQVAFDSESSAIRTAAVELLDSDQCLARIALNSDVMELRCLAANRIKSLDVIDAVIKEARQKDKSVYRILKGKLETLKKAQQEQQDREQQALEICTALERLTTQDQDPQLAAKWRFRVQQWQTLGPVLDSALIQRFTAADCACRKIIDHLQTQLSEQQQAEREQQQIRQHRENLLEELAAYLRQPERIATPAPQNLESDLEQFEQRWQALANSQPPSSEEDTLYTQRINTLKSLHQGLSRYLTHFEHLQQLLEEESPPVKALQSLLNSIDWPRPIIPAPQPLIAIEEKLGELTVLRHEAKAREQKQIDRVRENACELLDQLEAELDSGLSQQAAQTHGTLQKLLTEYPTLNIQASRYKRLHGRFLELRDWQNFAIQPKQEALCASMETLTNSTLDMTELAQQIKQLQSEWKALDAQKGSGSKGLWLRFKKAADKAYRPCQAHHEQQQIQRRKNLQEREALCAELGTFIQHHDWTNLDWKPAEQTSKRLKQSWRIHTPVERTPGRKVQTRFNQLLKQLDEQIDGICQRNATAKQLLIDQAATLLDQTTAPVDTQRIKPLQQQWKELGTTHRSQEQALWQSFRAVCDQVFEQAQAEKNAAKIQLQAALDQALQLCTTLERHPEAPLAEIETLIREQRSRFHTLLRQHGEVSRYQQRFEQAGEALKRRRSELGETIQQIASCDQFCHELEFQLLEGDEQRTDQEFLLLPWPPTTLPEPPFDKLLDHRYQQIVTLFSARELLEPLLQDAENALRLLCIRLEILAGLPSPIEDQAQRMEFQMSRLQEALTQSQQESHSLAEVWEQVFKLQQCWHCTPFNQVFESLEQRFQATLITLEN
jgi:hypothetical protein